MQHQQSVGGWLRRSLLLTGWAQLFNYIEVENSTSWEGRRNCEAEMSAARERCGKLDEMQRTYGSHVLLAKDEHRLQR